MAKPTAAKLTLPSLQWVIVEWDDAWGDAATAVSLAEAPSNHKPSVHYAGGWMLYQNEKGIKLVTEFCPEDETYRGQSFIPAGMIRKVIPFTLSQKKVKSNETSSPVPDPPV